ncbi:MAG TPA: glutamate--tRNA ligase family protein [Candidatus Angelobacter sp.]|nr:glutamate--tRNA ligase family protein [Candidatus Angelobacter sp.]
MPSAAPYRGRLAPSPTGYLHLGHARTFWVAHQRARSACGKLVFRNEDLDFQRAKPQFERAMFEDLRWLGLDWDEGPDMGGPCGPYVQSERRDFYLHAWQTLRDRGFIYPCSCSRKDLERALAAPHEDQEDDEIPYPGTCRHKLNVAKDWESPAGVSWRLKVPDGETVSFSDLHCGEQRHVAGKDFSDFLVWRRDDIPAYQLAVVVDDDAMRISEAVRGADLLKSTARQLLLFRALGARPPQYFHCPLLRDAGNVRLAKRHDALSLRAIRAQGVEPESLRERFAKEIVWQDL